MKLVSVNIGKAQSIERADKSGVTGIFKTPTEASIEVTPLGLAGDTIVDQKNHGGVDQAVYVFGTLDYAAWSAALDRELPPGIFGENLLIEALESAPLRIGDRFHFAQVMLEVTSPRIPCATLAARMGDPGFVKRFRHMERPGVYCRVITTGMIRVGETVTHEAYQGDTVSALEEFRLWYERDKSIEALERMLAAPIAIRSRDYYAAALAKQRERAE